MERFSDSTSSFMVDEGFDDSLDAMTESGPEK